MSMKSEICSPDFSRVFLCFMLCRIEVTKHLMLLANEISIAIDPNTGAMTHMAMSVAIKTVAHSRMTAIKYPIGLVHSNGNLVTELMRFC